MSNIYRIEEFRDKYKRYNFDKTDNHNGSCKIIPFRYFNKDDLKANIKAKNSALFNNKIIKIIKQIEYCQNDSLEVHDLINLLLLYIDSNINLLDRASLETLSTFINDLEILFFNDKGRKDISTIAAIIKQHSYEEQDNFEGY